MTLKAVLEAGGYEVTCATTTVDAVDRLNEGSFELVLCHAQGGNSEINPAILSYARFKEYEPATAILHTEQCSLETGDEAVPRHEILVEPQNIPDLLEQVANLIGGRALSILERELQLGGSIS
ncbi:MAG: hypothetical protein IT170_06120 [Bryobacterales bacterium]|nr:hypothetical protein [Bryobacterales bacterium]